MWKTIRDKVEKSEFKDKKSDLLADKIGIPNEKFKTEVDKEI